MEKQVKTKLFLIKISGLLGKSFDIVEAIDEEEADFIVRRNYSLSKDCFVSIKEIVKTNKSKILNLR